MSKQLKILVLTLSVAIVVFTIVGGLHVKAATNDGAYRQLVFSAKCFHAFVPSMSKSQTFPR